MGHFKGNWSNELKKFWFFFFIYCQIAAQYFEVYHCRTHECLCGPVVIFNEEPVCRGLGRESEGFLFSSWTQTKIGKWSARSFFRDGRVSFHRFHTVKLVVHAHICSQMSQSFQALIEQQLREPTRRRIKMLSL